MAYITQFYSWSTGNTITAARLNGNVTNIVNGLDGGTLVVNTGGLEIGGTTTINGSRAAIITAMTITGDVTQTGAAIDWDLIDNNASALSFDAAGKAGILALVTTDSSEGVTMSGTLGVTGATTLSSTLAVTGATTLTGQLNANDDIVIATGKAIQTGTTGGNTVLLQAYDVDGTAYTTFITLSAHATTPTCVFNGDITTTTQSQGDNSTKIATTAYVDAAVLAEDYWDRASTTLSPSNANDSVDIGTGDYITGGIINIDVDGTAENAAGSLTLGAGNDAGIFFNGTDLVLITNGAGASGIILDSEDDTVEIKGSGVLQATFNTGGLDLVSGDRYEINSTSVLDSTTLGTGVVTSSLTTVGALDSGSITSGFGAIDNGTSNITTGGILKIDVDGTAENAAGSLTMGAGNDAGIFFDGTDLVIITNGAGASGIKLDSEDDTVEILGSGTLQATFDTGGLNLVTGDTYEINGTSVLSATTLGAAVVTSSLTTVGALDSGSITSGFGNIDNGSSTLGTGAITASSMTTTGNVGIGAAIDANFELYIEGVNTSDTAQVQITDSTATTSAYIGQFSDSTYITNNTVFTGSWGADDAAVGVAGVVLGSGTVSLQTNSAGNANPVEGFKVESDGGLFAPLLLAAAASTDVNINGSNELHSVTSSLRFKEDVKDFEEDSAKIYDLVPVTYSFKKEYGGGRESGLIAEETVKHLPGLVVSDEEGPYSVKYSRLALYLLPEMKKLRDRIAELEGK